MTDRGDAPRAEDQEGGAAGMVAVVPARAGVVPLGADEAVAEAGGWAVVAGTGCDEVATALRHVADRMWLVELGPFAPGRWADQLAPVMRDGALADRHVVLAASPDGRDLAPRLAAALDRPLVAGAVRIDATSAATTRYGGRVLDRLALTGPVVATLQPGVRGVEADERVETGEWVGPEPPIELDLDPADRSPGPDPELVAELPPDPSTMDLAESDRIVGGGAGLGSPQMFEHLADLASRLGASPGGTRVVTDHGWLPIERQIGTTGVTVDPSLYVALGVSGAVQHTAGLGTPDHIISVNTDPHCPMMVMADLGLVCDAPAFLEALLARLAAEPA